jgi:iron complex outermembrane receptor protein
VTNASLTWRTPDQKYWVQLWARNMFDIRYYASRVETSVGDLQYLAAPRTYGVTIGSKF